MQTSENQRLENIMLGSMRIRQVRRQTKSASLSANTTGVDLQAYSLSRLRETLTVSLVRRMRRTVHQADRTIGTVQNKQ